MELESWDAWGADGVSSDFTHKSSVGDTNVAANSRHNLSNRYTFKKQPEPEPEQEVDYFQELKLEPSIRKTKKVRIIFLFLEALDSRDPLESRLIVMNINFFKVTYYIIIIAFLSI